MPVYPYVTIKLAALNGCLMPLANPKKSRTMQQNETKGEMIREQALMVRVFDTLRPDCH